EVSLPESVATAGYGLHPALSDATLHALIVSGLAGDDLRLPFSFAGVTLHAVASPTKLRAKFTRRAGDAVSLALADETGLPVATVASLVLRPVRAMRPVQEAEQPFRVTWLPIARGAAVVDAPAEASAETPADVVVHEV